MVRKMSQTSMSKLTCRSSVQLRKVASTPLLLDDLSPQPWILSGVCSLYSEWNGQFTPALFLSVFA